jgi:hypothetical protein
MNWQWLRQRLPHVQSGRISSSCDGYCFRIYGFKPHYRLCLIDYTRFAGRHRFRIGHLSIFDTLAPIISTPHQ